MRRVVEGYLIALALGMAMARWRTVQQTAGTLVLGMQTLPSICWLPLALLWFGLDEKAVILVVVLGSLFSMTEAAYAGFKNVPPLYQRAALTMGAGQLQLLVRVLIPAALPYIITGMKQSWSFAWRFLMAGELLYSDVGLGQLLMKGRDLIDIGAVVAVMVVIVIIGLAVNQILFAPLLGPGCLTAARRCWRPPHCIFGQPWGRAEVLVFFFSAPGLFLSMVHGLPHWRANKPLRSAIV